MSKIFPLIALVLVFNACRDKPHESKKPLKKVSKYPLKLGNIDYDSLIDDPTFNVCNGERSVVQYFVFDEKTYEGEMWALEKEVRAQYDLPVMEGQTGLVRIRFIVNCEGQAGRHRAIAMDAAYNAFEFDTKIIQKLLDITKSLKGWKIFKNKQQQPLDYYQYLIYKIKDGQLLEILP